MSKLEFDLQCEVTDALKRRGWLAFGFTTHPPQKGFPDIMACKNGRTVFLEIKRSYNVLSSEQRSMFRLLRGNGFDCFLISSASDASRVFGDIDEKYS